MVRCGVGQARSYGMTWESSLAAFVVLMFEVAPNFEEHPLIRRVLQLPSVPPDSRIEELWKRTLDVHWQAARQNYDPDAWHPVGAVDDT